MSLVDDWDDYYGVRRTSRVHCIAVLGIRYWVLAVTRSPRPFALHSLTWAGRQGNLQYPVPAFRLFPFPIAPDCWNLPALLRTCHSHEFSTDILVDCICLLRMTVSSLARSRGLF